MKNSLHGLTVSTVTEDDPLINRRTQVRYIDGIILNQEAVLAVEQQANMLSRQYDDRRSSGDSSSSRKKQK